MVGTLPDYGLPHGRLELLVRVAATSGEDSRRLQVCDAVQGRDRRLVDQVLTAAVLLLQVQDIVVLGTGVRELRVGADDGAEGHIVFLRLARRLHLLFLR